MNKPSINVTPLIDVLLVLLIIFMVVAPSKPTAFKAKVPAEPAQDNVPMTPHPLTLVVAVKDDASLRLNRTDGLGTVDDSEKLIESLQAEFSKREREGILRAGTNEIEKTVFIKAPKNLSYGSVAKVVDAVKLSGAAPIGLQIDDLQ